MGGGRAFREQVLEQGPVDVWHRPVVAWLRFWTQGWRFHGRASRSEFFWVVLLQIALVAAGWWVVERLGMTARWSVYADPFGVVLSPQVDFHLWEYVRTASSRAWFGFGEGKDAWPDGWDIAIIAAVLVTAVPRWSLLVRRLHDRDHTGLWVLLLVFTGPIGWLVVTGMVVSRSRANGARFDRGAFAGRKPSEPIEQQVLSSPTGV